MRRYAWEAGVGLTRLATLFWSVNMTKTFETNWMLKRIETLGREVADLKKRLGILDQKFDLPAPKTDGPIVLADLETELTKWISKF